MQESLSAYCERTGGTELLRQWHPTLNGTLTPQMVTVGSHKKVWWQCPEGHVWKAVVYARAGPGKSGCPVCAGIVRSERQDRYRSLQAAGKALAAQPR